jgi:hypothetical protein
MLELERANFDFALKEPKIAWIENQGINRKVRLGVDVSSRNIGYFDTTQEGSRNAPKRNRSTEGMFDHCLNNLPRWSGLKNEIKNPYEEKWKNDDEG